MNRPLLTAITTAAWLLPSLALAYNTPSELLRALEFSGQPRDMKVELHGNDGQTYASVWLRGSVQGEGVETIRANVQATVDVHTDGSTLRTRYELMVTDNVAYLRLAEVQSDRGEGGVPPAIGAMRGQWVAAPLNAEELALPNTMNGADVAGFLPADIDAMAAALLNQAFRMERKGFTGGHAYFLYLQPDFLERSVQLLAEKGLLPAEIDVQAAAEILQDFQKNITAEMKVDTDENDVPSFARANAHVAVEGITFTLKTESVSRVAPVVATAPATAMPVERFLAQWTLLQPQGSAEPVPAPPSGIRAPRARPLPVTSPAQPAARPRRSAGCTAEPGTLSYQQLVRKGICPLPAESRPRRGSQRR